VQAVVRASGVVDGVCVVFIPHTTAGVTVNENFDPDVKHDLLAKLAALIPERDELFRHAEGNSDAHLKATLVGNSATLLVDGGRLVLGRWQGVYFCEFDGPRTRDVIIKVMGEGG
jgi:secondary thiamine-phosphate synthase enzyme